MLSAGLRGEKRQERPGRSKGAPVELQRVVTRREEPRRFLREEHLHDRLIRRVRRLHDLLARSREVARERRVARRVVCPAVVVAVNPAARQRSQVLEDVLPTRQLRRRRGDQALVGHVDEVLEDEAREGQRDGGIYIVTIEAAAAVAHRAAPHAARRSAFQSSLERPKGESVSALTSSRRCSRSG
eukprot:COSAG04_NODE_10846_length_749_cov_0.890769_1_plen_184_part_10